MQSGSNTTKPPGMLRFVLFPSSTGKTTGRPGLIVPFAWQGDQRLRLWSPVWKKTNSGTGPAWPYRGHQEELIRAVKATGKADHRGARRAAPSRWTTGLNRQTESWISGIQTKKENSPCFHPFGDESPSSKLPITFPVAETQLPLVYNHKPTGRGDDYVNLTGFAAFPLDWAELYPFRIQRYTLQQAESGMKRYGRNLL